jgi:hypothetical protein
LRLKGGTHLGTGLGDRDRVRVLAKEVRQQGQNVLIIVHQQQMGHCDHLSKNNTRQLPIDVHLAAIYFAPDTL